MVAQFFFGILAYMRAVWYRSVVHIIYVGFCHYVGIIFAEFSFVWQYFAGVNWQVAKRTKVLSASM